MVQETITLYRAAGVYDAAGVWARHGAVAVRSKWVLAAGDEAEVRAKIGASSIDAVVDLSDRVLLPALVNAHAHLDLSLAGSLPYGGDFIGWIEQVMRHRATQTHSVTDAVRHGLRLSRANGVGWIGDVAGSAEAVEARIRAAPDVAVPGRSWLEVLGRGFRGRESLKKARIAVDAFQKLPLREPTIQLGLEAHAPYSTGADIYQDTVATSLATHLAETLEEEQFVRDAEGPFADLLRKIGRWDDSIRAWNQSPVQWFTDSVHSADEVIQRHTHWVAAHCNYVSNADIALLSQRGVSVAYCPIASEYFQHPDGGREPHRYREMIDAGINVCLGTDSIICQPPDEPQPMSIFAAMRRLYVRDAYDPKLLLEMATTSGVRAMNMPSKIATFSPGVLAKIISVRIDPTDPRDPLQQALLNRYPVEPVQAV